MHAKVVSGCAPTSCHLRSCQAFWFMWFLYNTGHGLPFPSRSSDLKLNHVSGLILQVRFFISVHIIKNCCQSSLSCNSCSVSIKIIIPHPSDSCSWQSLFYFLSISWILTTSGASISSTFIAFAFLCLPFHLAKMSPGSSMLYYENFYF